MTPPRKDPPPRTARGYTVRELAEREGISMRTAWKWVARGALKVSRLGPRLGVRVHYVDAVDDECDDPE